MASCTCKSQGEQIIGVVECYEHLGAYVNLSGGGNKNALHRCKSAMAAYVQLSNKVFGSELVMLQYKFVFMASLVMSRLLFAVYITVPKPAELKKYNAVYMRVLRRVSGNSRFSANVAHTDLQVRQLMNQPSIDCWIARARLAYCGRLVRIRPKSLLALLFVGNQVLPWVSQLLVDSEMLCMNTMPADFPKMVDDPQQWLDIMCGKVEWKALVNRMRFSESSCDRIAPLLPEGRALLFTCDTCSDSFATSKALCSHRRAKHYHRLTIKDFLSSAVCPCCKCDYRQRLRLIAHVSDSRRPKCRDWILQHCAPLSEAFKKKLDKEDTTLRREAQRRGRSHHIAVLPALRPDGQIIGRAEA